MSTFHAITTKRGTLYLTESELMCLPDNILRRGLERGRTSREIRYTQESTRYVLLAFHPDGTIETMPVGQSTGEVEGALWGLIDLLQLDSLGR